VKQKRDTEGDEEPLLRSVEDLNEGFKTGHSVEFAIAPTFARTREDATV
jgi:hypothetical protein